MSKMAKRYQYIERFDDLQGYSYPVIADYGEDGCELGNHAVWAWYVADDGEIYGFDPTDTLQWGKDSEIVAEFDDLDEALEYLRTQVDLLLDRGCLVLPPRP
jgi:hypothetical protein